LVPLRGFSPSVLNSLRTHCEVLSVPKGTRIQSKGKPQTSLLFLIDGEMLLREADGEILEIHAHTARAHFPLIAEGRSTTEGACAKDSALLRIPLTALKMARGMAQIEMQAQAALSMVEKSPEEQLEQRIHEDFDHAISAGTLQLPGMPEVAARISNHIDSPTSTSTSIARIIQMDPSITARLIQVSNSVAYGSQTRIKTCKDAVTRLGRNATRELVTGFVLKGLFRSRSAEIKKRMAELWSHSIHVAALCHVLAKRSPGFEPARAMLIGLVHDIGIIPLLTHAHRYEGLLDDSALLERMIQRLRGSLGVLTLNGWGFSEEFTAAAQEAEDWLRDTNPQPDYTDLLIVAQLHAYLGTPRMAQLPRIDEVPAFNKLALGALSPKMSLVLIDEAQQEIDEVRLLLS
jgi:HD-like signal output (HDOD) protein